MSHEPSSIDLYGEASSDSQDLPPDKLWNPWGPNVVRVLYFKDDSRSHVLMTQESGRWDFPRFFYKGGIEEGYRSTRVCRDFAKRIGQQRQFVYVAELIGISNFFDEGKQLCVKLVVIETADMDVTPHIELPVESLMHWKGRTFLNDLIHGIGEISTADAIPYRMDAFEAALAYSSLKVTFHLSLAEPRLLLGWFHKARDFLVSTIKAEGETLQGTVIQHQSTMASTVLVARTKSGKSFFLKAPACGTQEMSITQCLARIMPEYSVEVVSSDSELRSFVTRELQVGHVELEDAVMTLGRMQLESISHLLQLRTAGCPVLNLNTIRCRLMKWVSGYHSSTSSNIAHLFKDGGWYLLYLCRKLDSFKLPLTLVHGDFSISNVGIAEHDGRTVLYDWEFACISHPFLDFYRCTNLLGSKEDMSQDLIEKYLSIWTDYAPINVLKEGLEIGRVLGGILRVCSLWTRADACVHQICRASLDQWKRFDTKVLYERASDLKDSDDEYWKSEEADIESKIRLDNSSEDSD